MRRIDRPDDRAVEAAFRPTGVWFIQHVRGERVTVWKEFSLYPTTRSMPLWCVSLLSGVPTIMIWYMDRRPQDRDGCEMKALDWISAAIAFILMYLGASFLLPGLLALLCGAHSAQWTFRSIRQRRNARLMQVERTRRARNICPQCETDLPGNASGQCLECGTHTNHSELPAESS